VVLGVLLVQHGYLAEGAAVFLGQQGRGAVLDDFVGRPGGQAYRAEGFLMGGMRRVVGRAGLLADLVHEF